MSRLLSAVRRAAGNELLQDLSAGIVMTSFILAAAYGSAGITMLVAAWRATP